MQLRFTL